ncbi:MAG: molybdopterin oxidoreductase, partial [Candidatus Scalindua sp.]|nr:molybdopterin oxidoreductase [Candidatus Scalindua sp.]
EKWGLKENKLETGRDYTAREVVEILWHSKTKKDFSYALEHAFLGNHKNTKERYLSGVESKFKGPGKSKMKFYADQLVTSMAKVQETVTKHEIKNIDLANHKLAMLPLPVREHAKPRGHQVDHMPFYLITYKVSYRYHSGANISLNPVLRSLGKDATENCILINRDTAIKMGIRDGTMLVVESRIGKVKGKASLTEGIRPDTVAVSNSYGQWSPGLPEHTHKGMWINQALESNSDVISGMESYNDTKCKVYKV